MLKIENRFQKKKKSFHSWPSKSTSSVSTIQPTKNQNTQGESAQIFFLSLFPKQLQQTSLAGYDVLLSHQQ